MWLGVRAYLSHTESRPGKTALPCASRERFVLPQDFQYGELLIPAGSPHQPHRPL